MPIFANNLIVNNTPVPTQVGVSILEKVPSNVSPSNVQGTALVVNGKAKKISKKSAYLMDMLTLDDE